MLPALLILAALFALLFVARVSAARRRELIARWPVLLLAGAAMVAAARGAVWPALALTGIFALAWTYWPRLAAYRSTKRQFTEGDPGESEARAILGVGSNAAEAEIRSAYRAKMAQAHPDRGGKHADAARLTAARDRLLRQKR